MGVPNGPTKDFGEFILAQQEKNDGTDMTAFQYFTDPSPISISSGKEKTRHPGTGYADSCQYGRREPQG